MRARPAGRSSPRTPGAGSPRVPAVRCDGPGFLGGGRGVQSRLRVVGGGVRDLAEHLTRRRSSTGSRPAEPSRHPPPMSSWVGVASRIPRSSISPPTRAHLGWVCPCREPTPLEASVRNCRPGCPRRPRADGCADEPAETFALPLAHARGGADAGSADGWQEKMSEAAQSPSLAPDIARVGTGPAILHRGHWTRAAPPTSGFLSLAGRPTGCTPTRGGCCASSRSSWRASACSPSSGRAVTRLRLGAHPAGAPALRDGPQAR